MTLDATSATAEGKRRSLLRWPWRTLFLGLVAGWLLFVVLPTLPAVRVLLTRPLVAHDANARGDAAYVMSGGHAYRERLRAAADLYQMHRVSQIVIARDRSRTTYNFVEQRSELRWEQTVRYLSWLGVPEDAVTPIEVPEDGWFGSLSEARAFVHRFCGELKSVVVVTSAPHARRSALSFRRQADGKMEVAVHAASAIETSAEFYHPIWLEYLKLAIYYAVA